MIDKRGRIAAIYAETVAARAAAVLVHDDLHACQFIYPILAVPVVIAASGVAWTLALKIAYHLEP